jgi:hypothetical protein
MREGTILARRQSTDRRPPSPRCDATALPECPRDNSNFAARHSWLSNVRFRFLSPESRPSAFGPTKSRLLGALCGRSWPAGPFSKADILRAKRFRQLWESRHSRQRKLWPIMTRSRLSAAMASSARMRIGSVVASPRASSTALSHEFTVVQIAIPPGPSQPQSTRPATASLSAAGPERPWRSVRR